MAGPTDYARLRADVGESVESLSDEKAEAIWEQAESLYASPLAVYAAARVFVLRPLVAQAAKEVDHRLAESEEKASQTYKHLREMLTDWEAKLAAAPQTPAGITVSTTFFFGLAQGRRGL